MPRLSLYVLNSFLCLKTPELFLIWEVLFCVFSQANCKPLCPWTTLIIYPGLVRAVMMLTQQPPYYPFPKLLQWLG